MYVRILVVGKPIMCHVLLVLSVNIKPFFNTSKYANIFVRGSSHTALSRDVSSLNERVKVLEVRKRNFMYGVEESESVCAFYHSEIHTEVDSESSCFSKEPQESSISPT